MHYTGSEPYGFESTMTTTSPITNSSNNINNNNTNYDNNFNGTNNNGIYNNSNVVNDDAKEGANHPIEKESIDVTIPMKNLPAIKSCELKLIGRCVTFIADMMEHREKKEYYYEGMVSLVTRDTVVMADVYKYTIEGMLLKRDSMDKKINNRINASVSTYNSSSSSSQDISNNGTRSNSNDIDASESTQEASDLLFSTSVVIGGSNSTNNLPSLVELPENGDNNVDESSRTGSSDAVAGSSSNSTSVQINPLTEPCNLSNNGCGQFHVGFYNFLTFSRKKIDNVVFAPEHPITGVETGRDLRMYPFLGAMENKRKNKGNNKEGARDNVDGRVAAESVPNPFHTPCSPSSEPRSSPLIVPVSSLTPPPLLQTPPSLTPLSVKDIVSDPSFSGNKYRFADLERCRMLTRRYLVFTSLGINQRSLSLKDFIAERCPWPEAPEPLLREIAAEELALLVEVDKVILSSRQNATNGDGHLTLNRYTDNLLTQARLGTDNTYKTVTCLQAISYVMVTLFIWFYTLIGKSLFSKLWVFIFSRPVIICLIFLSISLLASSVSACYHSVRMQHPPQRCLTLTRIVSLIASSIITIIMLAQFIVLIHTDSLFIPSLSMRDLWLKAVRTEPSNVCMFMAEYNCTGYDSPCNYSSYKALNDTCHVSVLPYFCNIHGNSKTFDNMNINSLNNVANFNKTNYVISRYQSECPLLCSKEFYSSEGDRLCGAVAKGFTLRLVSIDIMLIIIVMLILSGDLIYSFSYLNLSREISM